LDKNILITGISGFVGSRKAKWLVEEGANVFGLLRRRADGKVPHNMLLAAQSFVPRSFEDPNETMLCNCWGTSNLLEAIRINAHR